MGEYKYRLLSAALQLGDKPPFTLWKLNVRMNGNMPQICIKGFDHETQEPIETWHDYPKDERRTILTEFKGQPVVGITSDWSLI
jgi:hypothetical protein